jgi:hypothetical protein
MTDLSLVETEDLTTELNKRFDAVVVIGVQIKTGQLMDTFYHRYSGGYASCLGLCNIMNNILLKDYFGEEVK